ncbi:hypothetical protein Sa4125_01630 [Aureimonas sp. SA4125]|nr:hypothetical protein Sa4125_01630 [Aureimonas sp. SA4125]
MGSAPGKPGPIRKLSLPCDRRRFQQCLGASWETDKRRARPEAAVPCRQSEDGCRIIRWPCSK